MIASSLRYIYKHLFNFFIDYLIESHQLHPIFTLWAASEPELAKALQGIAGAIESSTNAHQNLLDSTVNEEREYISYVDAVKDALNRRDAMQSEYELAVEELSKRRAEREQVSQFSTKILNAAVIIKNLVHSKNSILS